MTSKLNHENGETFGGAYLIFVISFLVFSAGMARDIPSKKPVPVKPWKKLISAEKLFLYHKKCLNFSEFSTHTPSQTE